MVDIDADAGTVVVGTDEELSVEQQAIAAQFGIRSIPTVKLFKDGRPVDEFAGALPEGEIRAFLDRHLPPEDAGDRASAAASALATL